jgi:hypothetical protein
LGRQGALEIKAILQSESTWSLRLPRGPATVAARQNMPLKTARSVQPNFKRIEQLRRADASAVFGIGQEATAKR